MPIRPDSAFDLALDRYLDQVIRGDLDDAPPEEVDAGVAATVRRLEDLNRAPKAEARFADRLLDHLTGASEAASDHRPNQPVTQRATRWGVRQSAITRQNESEDRMPRDLVLGNAGPFALSSRPGTLSQPRWGRTRWAVSELATIALLVLTIVTGLVAFGSWRPGVPGSPISHLAAISSQQPAAATPAASLEAPVALAEFVAEIRLGTGPSSLPSGMAVDADGTLYVIDAAQDQIRLFDPDGQSVATWGETGEAPGQFRFHANAAAWGDLAFGPDGNLYVVDTFNSRVQVLGPDGAFIREWGQVGGDEGQFVEPSGLVVDPSGRVYVADTLNGRVQVFDAEGQFLAAWAPAEDDGALLRSPNDVAVDTAGRVSVTDGATRQVIRFDADGTVIDTVGGGGTARDPLSTPAGVASDAQGNLFVADSDGNRIQVFTPDGTLLGTIGSIGVQPSQFLTPEYLTLGPDGVLYVSETGNRRIQVFRLLPPLGAATDTSTS